MIEAFHSTQEETIFSDLIIIVVDSDHGDNEKKITCAQNY
jgi:50S ribosomal subunit-associated GTPase HflX